MSTANPSPSPQIPSPQPSQVPDVGAEYDRLLSFFKYLVTLTVLFLGLMVTAVGILFYSNLKAVREDAKEEATRTATKEAQTRVSQAFEEKNLNAMILKAAQEKVGTITDKLVEQQVRAKLQPVEQRITLVGQISENQTRARMAFRPALEELNKLVASAKDPDTARFGKVSLETLAADFETRAQENMKRFNQKGIVPLQMFMMNIGRPETTIPSTLHRVVELIDHDSDLNVVAASFVTFRDLTGEDVKMFDFGAVHSWCSRNQPKCQAP